MILKIVMGRGARSLLDYISTAHKTDKSCTTPMFTNMAGQNSRELAREVAALRRSKPGLGKVAAHLMLSHDPNDRKLTNKEWERALQLALQGHGAENAPHAAYLHIDKEHQHLHAFFCESDTMDQPCLITKTTTGMPLQHVELKRY